MKRGDIVTVAASGDYGKPRPALIIQSDQISDTDSVLICLITSSIAPGVDYRRLLLDPTSANGLRAASQVMIDKILALPRSKIGSVIGRVDDAHMERISGLLALVTGLSDPPADSR